MKFKMIAMMCLLSGAGGYLWAGNILSDPQIPDGEQLSYNVKTGNEISTVKEKTFRKTVDGKECYETVSFANDLTLTLLVDRSKMELIRSVMTQKTGTVAVETATTLVKNLMKPAGDEIIVMDYLSINYLLRAVDFTKTKTLRVRNFRSDSFMIEITRVGEEDLVVNGKKVACNKLEMNLSGFWGALFPKTSFWYSKSLPHYLVRYEGTSAGPGSPKKVMELAGYTAK